MMGGDMDSPLACKCDVATIHPPLEPLQVMKLGSEPRHSIYYIYVECERASHMALDSVGGMCIDVQLHMQPYFP